MAGAFLNSGAQTGEMNMALDSMLLEAVAASGQGVLRLYRWQRPTLSLGYFQKIGQVADEAFMARRGVGLVMRPTGGGAILHDRELTFSLVLPAGHPALQGSINDSYLNLTRPLLDILRKLNVDARFRGDVASEKAVNCFAGSACPDIVVSGKKVFGSAQRRKDKAVLMHGSLLFEVDQELWAGVFASNLGQGFQGVGPTGENWEALLKDAYGRALGLDFTGELPAYPASGQATAAVLN